MLVVCRLLSFSDLLCYWFSPFFNHTVVYVRNIDALIYGEGKREPVVTRSLFHLHLWIHGQYTHVFYIYIYIWVDLTVDTSFFRPLESDLFLLTSSLTPQMFPTSQWYLWLTSIIHFPVKLTPLSYPPR